MPELAEPWLCQWAGCEEAHAQTGFSRPQHFYSHETSHAEVTEPSIVKINQDISYSGDSRQGHSLQVGLVHQQGGQRLQAEGAHAGPHWREDDWMSHMWRSLLKQVTRDEGYECVSIVLKLQGKVSGSL